MLKCRAMNLETRKYDVIRYLVNLQDESLFLKIESAIAQARRGEQDEPKRLTRQQLIDRAELSNKDYLAGRVKTQQELELESEDW